jgi:hypothetical protein
MDVEPEARMGVGLSGVFGVFIVVNGIGKTHQSRAPFTLGRWGWWSDVIEARRGPGVKAPCQWNEELIPSKPDGWGC